MTNEAPAWKVIMPSEDSEEPLPSPWQGEITSSIDLPVFPIMHWEPVAGDGRSVSVDDELGTAFFVTPTGLFLTAKHVVETCADDKPYSVLLIDRAAGQIPRARVIRLALHPVLDAAIGFARVPTPVPCFRLGTDILNPRELVFTLGYSKTQLVRVPSGGTLGQSLAVNFRPDDYYRGVVEGYYPEGHGIAKGWPVYRHNADILGGISGGPLIRASDSAVYGINCSGFAGYGTATVVQPLLDWPIDFLDGQTLRSLSRDRPDLIGLYSKAAE